MVPYDKIFCNQCRSGVADVRTITPLSKNLYQRLQELTVAATPYVLNYGLEGCTNVRDPPAENCTSTHAKLLDCGKCKKITQKYSSKGEIKVVCTECEGGYQPAYLQNYTTSFFDQARINAGTRLDLSGGCTTVPTSNFSGILMWTVALISLLSLLI